MARRSLVPRIVVLAVCVLLLGGCGNAPKAGEGEGAAGRDGSQRPAQAFDATRAMEHIRQLSVGIGPRIRGAASEHLAAAYIRDTFSEIGYENVTEQPFASDPGHTGYNVYVEDAGARPEWVIIVGAHYDTAGGTGSPGANDNASGVGVMLELARVFREERNLPTLLFVAFSSEEYSEDYEEEELVFGSEYMASFLEKTDREVVGMVNLDMVGVGNAPFTYATLDAPGTLSDLFIAFAGRQGVTVEFVQDPGDWSDNESFEEEGISSFTLEWQLDADYHSPRDTFERIEVGLIAQSGRLLEGFLEGLSAFTCRTLENGDGARGR